MSVDLKIIVKAVDQASGTIQEVGREVNGLETKAGRLGGILKGGLLIGAGAAVAGIGALGAVLGASVAAASDAEDIQAQLNAVLKSTEGVAGMTAEAINEHALALSKVTKFEDDAIVASSALMLTFTKVGSDIFPQATEATLDMAQAMGMDLNSATMLVGKALNDPVKGMTALTRSGIQFTAEQQEMVKAMVAAGDAAGAQQIILKELETQFGGSAEAAGDTLSGKLEILKNQFGNVKEEIGGALIPVLTRMSDLIGPVLVRGFESFAGLLDKTILPALDKFGQVFTTIFYGFAEDGWNFSDLIEFLTGQFPGLTGVIDKLGGVSQSVGGFVETFKTTLVNIGTAIASQVTPTIETLAGIWREKLQPAFEVLGQKLQETLFPALQRLWEWFGTVLPPVIETLGTFFREKILPVLGDVAAFVVEKVMPAIVDLAAWFMDKIPVAVAAASDAFNDVSEAIGKIVNWLKVHIPPAFDALKAKLIDTNPSVQTILGLFKDTGAALGDVWSWMKEKIPGAVDAVKGAFDDAAGAVQGVIDKVRSAIDAIMEAIARIREFLGLNGAFGSGATGYQNSLPGAGGGGYGSTPSAPVGGGGYGSTAPGRSASGMIVNLTVNAPGGNPMAVAQAAQTGVLAAARSMGIA